MHHLGRQQMQPEGLTSDLGQRGSDLFAECGLLLGKCRPGCVGVGASRVGQAVLLPACVKGNAEADESREEIGAERPRAISGHDGEVGAATKLFGSGGLLSRRDGRLTSKQAWMLRDGVFGG